MFRKSFSLLLFTACLLGLSAGARPALDKPNVIVVLLDDAGYADFSHTGHPTIDTPAISKLAAEGMNFTRYYCGSPACSASRYSLLTGRNPRRSGLGAWVLAPQDARYIHPNEVTLAEGLRDRGYATGMFGKWHLGNPNSSNGNTPNSLPLAHGFDEWLGTNVSHDYADGKLMKSNPAGNTPVAGYDTLVSNIGSNVPVLKSLTGLYKDAATAFIRAHKGGPFLAYVAPNMPHLGIHASDPFLGTSEQGLLGDVMAELDDLIGALRRTVEEEGIAQNTLIILSSDNGHWIKYQDTANDAEYGEARAYIGSARPFRDGKGSTWEGGVRVPGVWFWPGTISARRVVSQQASNMDVLPTVFALAGEPLPTGRTLDGRDIRPYLNPTLFPGSVADFTYIYTGSPDNFIYGATKGPWKLHTHLYSQTGNNYGFAANSANRTTLPSPLLFNVETDPSERFNVAGDNPTIVSELQAVISAFNTSVNSEQTFWGAP